MKLKFIGLDYDYFNLEGQDYVKITGRSSERKSVCLVDKVDNFFYVLSKKPEKILAKIWKVKDVKKAEILEKSYLGKKIKVIRIYCDYSKTKDVGDKIKRVDKNLETRERDIGLITRYITEKGLKPLVWYEIEGELITGNDFGGAGNLDFDLCLSLKESKELDEKEFNPKVLAFDIEVENLEIGKGEILMISLVSDNFKKVLTWKKCDRRQEYVECFKDEEEILEKFGEYVNKIDPDIITGYFSDGFDFPYLRARAEENGINLKLGREKSRILFSRGRPLNAKIKGLVHVDLLKFIETVYSQYLQSETLGLNDVSKELLGEGKLEVDHEIKADDRSEKQWKDYFEYNLQDSILTYKLFHKLWPDMLEFTRIVQEPLFIINRFSMTGLVENYFIHNLNRFNEIAEKRPLYEEIGKRRMRGKYEGAFVLQPKPALYENLAIFDFTSMYASIIVSFNLSHPTFLEKKEKDSQEVELEKGKKVYFSKKKGFIPSLLEEIIVLRKKYKKELREKPDAIKKARSNAFKLLANAAYGYNGFFGARYYCLEAAASTAALARKFIKQAINKTEKQGYKVIYADTDGFAFLLNKKTKKETKDFLKILNSHLPGIMELELEDFYKRGLWVTKRTGEFGAKKKYALITEDGKLKIRGFETVRRDWCYLAREVQNTILNDILKDGNQEKALKFTKAVIKKIKKREVDKRDLIIRTQLKKPLSEYKSEGPHVAIARKMQEKEIPVDIGMLISYFVGESKKKRALVRERALLPEEKGEYDIEYYLNHQILPAVENIFEVFGVNVKEIIKGSEQKKLF